MVDDLFTAFREAMETLSREPLAGVVMFLLLLAYLGLPWILLRHSHKQNKAKRLMDALPTSKVRGVFIGLVEVKGKIELTLRLTSYLAERECAWYRYTVEEQWRRVVTEACSDGKGRVRMRTRVQTGWTEVDSGGNMNPFYLVDDTGRLLVHPEGARIEACELVDRYCGRGDPLYYGKGPQSGIPNTTHTRRFREEALPDGCCVYVIGQAWERRDVVAPEIRKDDLAPMFLISVKNEEDIVRARQISSWAFFIAGLFVIAGIPWLYWYHGNDPDLMTSLRGGHYPLWLVAGIIYLIVWSLSWTWTIYNMMVDIRNRVKQAESQVAVQLKRRYDLVPRLVNVVSAYAAHEQELQARLADIRSSLAIAGKGREQTAMLAEAYPDLKAQPLFEELSRQLADTEDRIALAREYSNSIVNHYNTLLQVFPEGIIARTFGLRPFARR